jgi:hypothetical protein
MRDYVIYRHGWNEANQKAEDGLPEKVPVLRVQARSPEDAVRRAMKQASVAAGQRLIAEPAAGVDAKANNLDLKAEAL